MLAYEEEDILKLCDKLVIILWQNILWIWLLIFSVRHHKIIIVFVPDTENSTKQSLLSCKTEIAKPDAIKKSFVTVSTVIAVVCIACVMVFLFKKPCPDHWDERVQPQIT